MTEQQNDLTTANLDDQVRSSDLFVTVMRKQKAIQAILGNSARLDQPEYLREQALALIVEVAEALQEKSWKSWKKNHKESQEKFREELVDVQLFLCNLILVAGIEAGDFMQLCLDKQAVTIKRQLENY